MDKHNASILLISNDPEEYEFLKSAGFTNICYMPSYGEASSYFERKESELDKFDLVLFGSGPVISGSLTDSIRDHLKWNEIKYFGYSKNDGGFKVEFPFYAKLDNESFISTVLEEIEEPIKGTKVSSEFNLVLDGELPKQKSDVKILVLDLFEEAEILAEYLGKLGFEDVDIDEASRSRIYNYVNKFKNYDIVLANGNLLGELKYLNNEIHAQQLQTRRKTQVFLSELAYSFTEYNRSEVLSLPVSKGEEESGMEVDYFALPKLGLNIIVDIVLSMYSKRNKLSDYEPQDDFSKYQKYVDDRQAYERVLGDRFRTLNYIKQCLGHFNNYVIEGKIQERFKSLKLNRISDGLSISMFVGPREVACLTFLDEDNPDNYGFNGVFRLQRLSEKGKLMPPKKIVMPEYDSSINNPSAITDEEMKIVDAIHKRIIEEFIPEYDRIETTRISQKKRSRRKKGEK